MPQNLVRAVLAAHRRRLERQRSLITAQIDDIDRFTTKGISMPTRLSGCRPVQIKIAVEKVFGVKVLSVNTLNRPGKRKRTRTGYGKRKNTKRAIVTLSEESRTIDVFGGRVS